MLSRIFSYGLAGLAGYLVTVEANVSGGMPLFEIVGLPDAAVRESRERVRAALINSGFAMPFTRVVINLAPADTKKVGPLYDLPIALAVLLASGQLGPVETPDIICIGELSMGGGLAPIRGALPVALSALSEGRMTIMLPHVNAPEIACVEKLTVLPAQTLQEAALHIAGRQRIQKQAQQRYAENAPLPAEGGDIADVVGQHMAKRALEIAAAGGHSLLMSGPPGDA